MSRLQEFVFKLSQVIIGYYELQKTQAFKIDLTKKSAEEHLECLRRITAEATEGYPDRLPLLTYYLFVLEKVKFLVDKNAYLDETEVQIVAEQLSSLLNNTRTLLATSQSTTVGVLYNEKAVQMKGCVRGSVSTVFNGGMLSQVGGIIEGIIYKGCNISRYPDARTSKESLKLYKDFILNIIDEHQSPLLIPKLRSDIEAQEQEKAVLQQALFDNQAELETIKTTCALLERTCQTEQAKQCSLTQEVETLRAQVGALEEKLKLSTTACVTLDREVSQLRVDNSALRRGHTNNTRVNNNSLLGFTSYAGLLGGRFFLPPSSSPDDDGNNQSDMQFSPGFSISSREDVDD